MGIIYHEFLLIATCEKTNFVHAIPMQNRQTETIANALLHRVCCLTGPPTKLSIDQDAALTSVIIKEMLTSLECTMQIISPWNHGSSKAERQIQTIGNMINKHLTQKGASWPLYAAVSAYAMNTFTSTALQGLSPFELVFARKPQQLTSFELPKLTSFPVEYREFFRLLLDRAKMYRDMEMEWRTLQALKLREKNKMLTNIETFQPNDLVYLLAPYSSSLQSKAQKFRQDYIGPLAIDTKLDDTHYLLKDVTGRTLPGDYHINRIKRAKEVTLDGLADTYEQLRNHIGLPNDACTPSQKSGAAPVTNKMIWFLKHTMHLRNKEPIVIMKFLLVLLLVGACQTHRPITERSWVKFRKVKYPTYNGSLLHQEPDILRATDILIVEKLNKISTMISKSVSDFHAQLAEYTTELTKRIK